MPGARRFDVGEKCTASLPGAIAALEQIQEWGMENIAVSLAAINTRIAEHLAQLGCRLPEHDQRCPHMFGARLPEACVVDTVAKLRAMNIHISQRGEWLRISPHLHASDHDVDRLIEATAELIG